ncbi:hypothetical protein LCGC14_2972970 [marine sediment metagenome]|uniref:Uncharacterized protein n=1 Tax=marine sediment metagenome TaxID=412755 RepID=A0A0F8XWB6_9ZZZZ
MSFDFDFSDSADINEKLEIPIDIDNLMSGSAGSNAVVMRRRGFVHILKCLAIKKPSKEEQEIIDGCVAVMKKILKDEVIVKRHDNIRKGAKRNNIAGRKAQGC